MNFANETCHSLKRNARKIVTVQRFRNKDKIYREKLVYMDRNESIGKTFGQALITKKAWRDGQKNEIINTNAHTQTKTRIATKRGKNGTFRPPPSLIGFWQAKIRVVFGTKKEEFNSGTYISPRWSKIEFNPSNTG